MTAVSHQLNAERLVLFGWSRAILLQLAHPLVAAGVAEHSAFRKGVFTAARRLHATTRAMLALTFGSEAERQETLDGINAIHRRVHGVLPETVGLFQAGTYYTAEDSDLLVWVHATLLESVVLVYERVIGPLSDQERDQYCMEAEPVVRALHATGPVPTTWTDLQMHLADMYRSGKIVVGSQARTLGRAVLAPPFAALVSPLTRLNRLMTVGLLPQQIRVGYGFEWTGRDRRALRRWTSRLRRVRPMMPDRLARWPEARRLPAGQGNR